MEKTIIKQDIVKPVLIYKDPNTGLQISKLIEHDIAVVGRSSKADISVNYEKLSRNHFMIFKESGIYKVKDLDSTNGIKVNGKRVKIAVLTNNSEISVAELTFKFVITNQDFTHNSVPNIMAPTFEKVYIDKKTRSFVITNKKLMFFASLLAVLLLVFFLLPEQETASNKTYVNKPNSPKIHTMEAEISRAGLSVTKKKKAMLSYKLAEHHFQFGNYELAKKAMETYLSLVPDSDLAPAFIANCEEAIKKLSNINNKLKEIQETEKKQATIERLLKEAKTCLSDAKYDCAVNAYEKVLEIDEYNEEANAGILKIDNLQAELDKNTIEEKTEDTEIPEDKEEATDYDKEWDVTAKQMEVKYNNKEYLRAYEIALDILKNKPETTGYVNQSKATKIKNKITHYYNKKFLSKMKRANLLAKSDAKLAAVKIYKSILARFPYHKPARLALARIYKFYHQKSKKLYQEALVAWNYQELDTAKAKLKEIISSLPKKDPYYRKANSLLRKIVKQEEMQD